MPGLFWSCPVYESGISRRIPVGDGDHSPLAGQFAWFDGIGEGILKLHEKLSLFHRLTRFRQFHSRSWRLWGGNV